MELKIKDKDKKIKFYDSLVLYSSIGLLITFLYSFLGFFNILTMWVYVLLLGFVLILILIFYFGMLFWMVKTNNYILFILSLLFGFITYIFYFAILRRKYFKD